MTTSELLNALDKLLKQHVAGTLGEIDQEPYKGDFFKLFAASFEQGAVHGDKIIQNLRERGSYKDESPESALLFELMAKWNEWLYAWKNHPNQAGDRP